MLTVLETSAQRLTTAETAIQAGMVDATLAAAEIERLIGAASGTIARHCNRVFGRRRLRERFWGTSGALIASQSPVMEIHAITVDGAELDPAGYEVDAEAGLLYRLDAAGERCPWYGRRLVVEYSAGWILPGEDDRDLPGEVEQACLLVVSDLVAGAGRDPRLRSESVEGVGAVSWLDPRQGTEQLPSLAVGYLAGFRRPAI
jgi:hypothetical protein